MRTHPTAPADLSRHSVAVRGLFALALIAALYVGQVVLIPICFALMLNLLLSPPVRWLRRNLGVPTVLAATLVLGATVGGVGYGIYRGAAPAHQWLKTIPERWTEIERKLTQLKQPLDDLSQAGRELDEVTKLDGLSDGERRRVQFVATAPESLAASLMRQGGDLGISILLVLLLTFLTLASGESFLQRIVAHTRRMEDKKRIVAAVRTVERNVSRYLACITAINAGLGVAVGTALWLAGFPNPVLFGAVAGILNFIPYAGAVVGIALVTVVSALTFDSTGSIILPSALYLGLTSLEAYVVTPAILGRSLSLDPVVVFVSVLALGVMWGVAGAFIAVPLVMTFKIACDHIDGLRTIGALLGPSTLRAAVGERPLEGTAAGGAASGLPPAASRPAGPRRRRVPAARRASAPAPPR